MNVWVVLRKELIDTLRDRRTLWAMILGPVLVMPLFVILPQKLIEGQRVEQQATVIRLAVGGAEGAPALVEFIQASGEIELLAVDHPAVAVREGQAGVGLILPPGFDAALGAEHPAVVQLLADQSKMASSLQAERVRGLLQRYAQTVIVERLAARGMDPAVLAPYALESVNLATDQQMGGLLLGLMLPMFIVLWALIGGMYTAIDVTAGEKERLTLEPLLTTPAGRGQIVFGKLLAVMATSVAALALSVTSMLVAFSLAFPGNGETGEMVVRVEPVTGLLILLATLPLVLMFSGLEMAVCLLARSFKEAQNYIVPLQFVVLLPAMGVMVLPDLAPALPAFAIPVFSTLVVLRDLFAGHVDPAAMVLMSLSSLVYGGLAVGLAVWQFNRERVLFRV
jgi:sodium transport system permease protein